MNDIKATEKTSDDKKTDKILEPKKPEKIEKTPEIKKQDKTEKIEKNPEPKKEEKNDKGEKPAEPKKKEAEATDKKSSWMVAALKNIISFLFLAAVVAIAAFPFVAPQKFDEITHNVFDGFIDTLSIKVVKNDDIVQTVDPITKVVAAKDDKSSQPKESTKPKAVAQKAGKAKTAEEKTATPKKNKKAAEAENVKPVAEQDKKSADTTIDKPVATQEKATVDTKKTTLSETVKTEEKPVESIKETPVLPTATTTAEGKDQTKVEPKSETEIKATENNTVQATSTETITETPADTKATDTAKDEIKAVVADTPVATENTTKTEPDKAAKPEPAKTAAVVKAEPNDTNIAKAEEISKALNESISLAQSEHKALESEIQRLHDSNNMLEERIISLEKLLAFSSFDTKRRALAVIAVMDLQAAVQKGKNFQKELDRLNALSSKDIQDKLENLKSLNGKVKSDYALQQDFKAAMMTVINLPSQKNPDSFWAKVENVFRSLIVIRKTTDTAPDFQSKLNKAEKLVNEFMFTDALTELKNAPTEADIIFNPWREAVNNKESAKQIINEVLNDSLVNFGVFNAEEPIKKGE